MNFKHFLIFQAAVLTIASAGMVAEKYMDTVKAAYADAGVTTQSTQPASLAKNTDGKQTEVIVTNGGAK